MAASSTSRRSRGSSAIRINRIKGSLARTPACYVALRAWGPSVTTAQVATALENLRIDLLRVSAGQAAGPGITEHLEAARRIGREVGARIEVE